MLTFQQCYGQETLNLIIVFITLWTVYDILECPPSWVHYPNDNPMPNSWPNYNILSCTWEIIKIYNKRWNIKQSFSGYLTMRKVGEWEVD